MKIKYVLGLAMAAAMLLVSGCGSDKAGVIDAQRIVQESEMGKQFKQEIMDKQKEISDKLEQEKAGLSPEDLQKRQMELNQEYNASVSEKQEQFKEALDKAYGEVAKEKGVSVIIYKESVASGGVDVTDDVIKKLQ
jgi:outer membrane protein